MVRISKSVEYALVVLKHMASHPGDRFTVKELSSIYDLPFGLLAKVLQRLAAARVVESTQGKHGGYSLAASLDGLSFLELSEVVDGPSRFAACERNEHAACDRATICTVTGPVSFLGDQVSSLLSNISVRELLAHR